MHILAAEGCFLDDRFFYAPTINIDNSSLEKLFMHKRYLRCLLKRALL